MVAQQVMVREDHADRQGYLRAKRILDISLTLLALIPAGLVMLVTAIAIWVDSPGPIIFRQKRIGINGSEFNLYKFRSMYHNVATGVHEEATARFIRGDVLNADADMPYKLGHDPRIARWAGSFAS